MYVVVRTPSEEAELVVRAFGDDLLLSVLIERVTGQPAPPVVAIDGRSVTTDIPFTASGVATGSVIALADPPRPDLVGGPHCVTLVQTAGTGAGTLVDLEPGVYRIGPGRRVTAPELEFAPVDESAIQITVQEDSSVVISHAGRPTWVDGRPFEGGTTLPWVAGHLEGADRVFALRRSHDGGDRPSTRRTVGADGRSSFNRPPRHRGGVGDDEAAASAPLDDALRIATLDSRDLWRRRTTDRDSLHIPLGLAPADRAEGLADDRYLKTLTVDLQNERAVGIVGGSDFTRAAARGLLLLAATGYGPADLDIAVVTSAARLPAWEWVKWLPHATVVDDPQLFGSEAELRAWIGALRTDGGGRHLAESTADSGLRHRTLVVSDDPALWHDRGSMLREMLAVEAIGADHFRYIVLGGTPEEVPAICTTVLEERQQRGSVVERFTDGVRVDDVHPFLVPEGIAVGAARGIASLDDPELAPVEHLPRSLSLEQTLALDQPDAGALAGRWIAHRDDAAPTARIGVTLAGDPLDLTFADGGLELLASGGPDAGTGSFLESLLVAMAIERQPDDVNFLLFDLTGRFTFTPVAELPHTVGVWTDPSPAILRRCVRCLRAELVARRELDPQRRAHLFVVLDEAAPEAGRSTFVAEVVDIIEQGARYGMHLIAATHRQNALDPSIVRAARRSLSFRFDGAVDLDQAALPRFVAGRAVFRDSAGATHVQTPSSFGTTLGAVSPHAITPFVIGRDQGAMERRLGRLNALAPDRSDDARLAAIVDTVGAAAADLGQDRQAQPCPAPLPTELTLAELLARHPGDGVPFALEDLPDEQRVAPCWWQPDAPGGLAVIGGSPRERTAALLSLALGIAQRTSADDVHLYVVGGRDDMPGAETPVAGLLALPHTAAVIGLDEGDRLDAMVQLLDDEITRRADLAEQWGGPERVVSGEPAIAILIDDVGELGNRLRRASDGDGILIDLQRVVREGGSYGICAFVTAASRGLLPQRLPDTFNVFALLPIEADEMRSLGLDDVHLSGAAPGRAIRVASRSEVQIAAPPEDVVSAIAQIGAEPALHRPPIEISETGGHDDAKAGGDAAR
ncbi:MAG: FtsK/SpoIIIE domain-containing protein [Acidimicrobiia bacterium]|nr:FtsK/SpoIIIE domain-containing protein [Acidimicrobiia bacterium]